MRAPAAAALLLLVSAGPAGAGDRQLEVLFANLTPDAESSEASRTCVRALEKRLKDDYTHLNKVGETALRKLTGKTAGEPFLEWPAAAFKTARERPKETWIDAVILVDCRPEKQTLDVLVQPASGGTVRLALRKVELDAAATAFAGEAILRRAWSGFSP